MGHRCKSSRLNPTTRVLSRGSVFRNSTSHDLSRDNHSTSDRARHELALWCLHRPAWVGHHTSGFRLTPTVHPCSRKGGGCGWLTAQKHNNHRNMSPDCNNVNIMPVIFRVSAMRKVNAWRCARRPTDRDLVGVIPDEKR